MNTIESQLQECFSIPDFEPYLKNIENEVDYFKGVWSYSPLFLNNLCYYNLILNNYNPIIMIKILKSINSISATINKFESNTIIYPHTDSDLMSGLDIVRFFIPLEKDYVYEFKGSFIQNNVYYSNKETILRNKSVLFSPYEDHSYVNLQENAQYFIIADIIKNNIKDINYKILEKYISFCIENYI